MENTHARAGSIGMLLMIVALSLLGEYVLHTLAAQWKWVQIPFHSAVEALGVLAALFLARLLILLPQQDELAGSRRLWAASGLIAVAILDAFHSFMLPGDLFVWLHSMSMLIGGVLFALIWLPVRAASLASIPMTTAIVTTAFSLLSLAFPDTIPAMLGADGFTGIAIAINLLGGTLFLFAGVRFTVGYYANAQGEDLVLAALAVLFGMSGVLFQFSQTWTADWWFWHLLRLVAYLIATGFALYLFQQTQISLEASNAALQSEIISHQKAEEALQQVRDELEVKVRERTASLVNILQEAQEAINVLSTSANEILTAISQLTSSSMETSTAVSETTTTVEEVRQTAQLSAKKAKDIAEAAQHAADVLQAGQASVEAAVTEMDHIRDQMSSIAETIVTLSEQSHAVGEITGTVNELAEQSNLLAVNAAIEAAQAGEQGKGFAVVAQEIKSLAEQSKQATGEVRGLLAEIQQAISNAVIATEQASKVVETGVAQSKQAGESIRTAVEATTNVARASTQIAASSQQQLIGVDQVAVAMENINQASTQNAQSSTQVESVSQGLLELSHKLKALVEQSPD